MTTRLVTVFILLFCVSCSLLAKTNGDSLTPYYELFKFSNFSDEHSLWLKGNPESCDLFFEFLKRQNHSQESKDFIPIVIEAKINNHDFFLERIIELYEILQKNPDALIDGAIN